MKYSEEIFREAVKNAYCIADIIRHFNGAISSGSYKIIRKYIIKYNIDISHFDPDKRKRENFIKTLSGTRLQWKDILIKDSTYTSSHNLKHKLYAENIKQRICELCGQDENWNNKKMSLILDHINGEHTDNRLENLRIVCPNCNATLGTHCGKNLKKEKRKYICDCGNEKAKGANLCMLCFNKKTRKIKERPSKQELLEMLKTISFVQLGKNFGVSDNAIRKWIK